IATMTTTHDDNATTWRDLLPIPPGATAGDWLTDCSGKGPRSLECSKHDSAGIGVAIDRWQFVDGRVERCVSLYDTEGRELTALTTPASSALALARGRPT